MTDACHNTAVVVALPLPRRAAHIGRSCTPPAPSSSASSLQPMGSNKRALSPQDSAFHACLNSAAAAHHQVEDTDQPRVNWTHINDLRCLVLLAHEAQRWQDMAEAMSKLVREDGGTFGRVEQYWLSLAYKNCIQPSRHAWHTMSSMLSASSSTRPPHHLLVDSAKEAVIRRYRERMEVEMHRLCKEVFITVEYLQSSTQRDVETQVFLYKMKGDYQRYAAEVTSCVEQREKSEGEAIKAYEAGLELAKRMLPSGSPLYLSLVLNYAVFYHEALRRPAEAIAIAQAAVERSGAGPAMAALSRRDREDSASVRSMLAASLSEWRAQQQRELEERARMEIERRNDELEEHRRRLAMVEDAARQSGWCGRWNHYGEGIELLPPGLADLPELG